MEVKIYNQNGEETGTVNLTDGIFNVGVNQDLIHQAVVAQTAEGRRPLAHAKGRGEVRGGGKKPWRQKGTGRARHGSIRSPIWKGGGVTHGPTKERLYAKKINKKSKRKALFMSLSSKVQGGKLIVIESITMDAPKTKTMKEILEKISERLQDYRKTKKKRDTVLLIQPGTDKELIRAVRNLAFAKALRADSLNVRDILERKYLVLLKDSIPVIEKTYLKNI